MPFVRDITGSQGKKCKFSRQKKGGRKTASHHRGGQVRRNGNKWQTKEICAGTSCQGKKKKKQPGLVKWEETYAAERLAGGLNKIPNGLQLLSPGAGKKFGLGGCGNRSGVFRKKGGDGAKGLGTVVLGNFAVRGGQTICARVGERVRTVRITRKERTGGSRQKWPGKGTAKNTSIRKSSIRSNRPSNPGPGMWNWAPSFSPASGLVHWGGLGTKGVGAGVALGKPKKGPWKGP